MGIEGPDSKLSFSQVNSSNSSENNTSIASIVKIEPTPPVIKLDTNASKIEPEQNLHNNSLLSSPQNVTTIQPTQNNLTTNSIQNNSLWNGVIIGLSVSAMAIMLGVIIFVKTQRGKVNAR